MLTYQKIIYEKTVGLALAQGYYSVKELEDGLSFEKQNLLDTLQYPTMHLLHFCSVLQFLLILL